MQSTNPVNLVKCSVVIPSHNCLHFLKQSLASVQQQTVENIEIIIVDDDSSDGSWDWLQQQKQKDNRIKTLQVKVRNPAKARNIAVNDAQSEWIAFLDADDSWEAYKLERQLNFHHDHPEVALSFGDYRHIDMDGKDLGTCFEFWPGYQHRCLQAKNYQLFANGAAELFAQNVVGTSTVVLKRTAFIAVGGFDESLISAEDWDLWLKLAINSQVGIGNYVDTTYLVRPESESSKKDFRVQAMQLIFERYQHTKGCGTFNAIRIALSRISVAEAEKWLSQQRPVKAFFAHSKALLLTPSYRRLMETLSDVKALYVSLHHPR